MGEVLASLRIVPVVSTGSNMAGGITFCTHGHVRTRILLLEVTPSYPAPHFFELVVGRLFVFRLFLSVCYSSF